MELVKKIESANIFKKIALVLFGTLLLTISAKIKVPFSPVPMTMQTFVVVLIGITLGWKLGLITVFAYLFEGGIGLPVFAGTPEKGIGLIYFTGPTMGYLIGFLVAVYFAGVHKDLISFSNYKYINALTVFSSLLVSVSFIYILGLVWLGYLIGWDKPIFKLGAQPFLLAELFKLFLLSALYPWIIKLNKII